MQTSLGGSFRNPSEAETPFLDMLGTSKRVVALRDEVRKEGLTKHNATLLEKAKAKGVILRGIDQRWVIDNRLSNIEQDMLINVESQRQHRKKIGRIVKGEEVNVFPGMNLPPLTDLPDPEAPTEELFPDFEIRRYFRMRVHFEDLLKAGDFSLAESALDYYNTNTNKDEVKYELTETLGFCIKRAGNKTYHHSNFYARPIQGCSDSSTKLFFAELVCGGCGPNSEFVCILDDDSYTAHGSKTAHSCSFCNQNGATRLAHPVTGYHGAPLTAADHTHTTNGSLVDAAT